MCRQMDIFNCKFSYTSSMDDFMSPLQGDMSTLRNATFIFIAQRNYTFLRYTYESIIHVPNDKSKWKERREEGFFLHSTSAIVQMVSLMQV